MSFLNKLTASILQFLMYLGHIELKVVFITPLKVNKNNRSLPLKTEWKSSEFFVFYQTNHGSPIIV